MKNYTQDYQTLLISYLLALFLMGIYNPASAQNTSWESNGPYGGHINCLTLSKTNPDILYAGTKHGIYKTENGGESWTKTNFNVFYEVTSIKVHSTNSDIILAGTKRKGVYRSPNGGQSWKYMGLWDLTISTMAIDTNNPDVLYFGTGEELNQTNIGIYKVQNDWGDGGSIKYWKSWGECGWRKVCKVLVDPDSTNWIYAAGINSGYCSNYGGILISQDGGDTWDDKNTGYDDAVSNIAITKNNLGERTIFAVDGGTWTSVKSRKLFKSTDMGETWEEVESPYSEKINPNILITHPTNPNSIIIGSYYNHKPLWIYNNETDIWDFINGSGLPRSSSPTSFEISADGNTMYLTTLHGGIYKYNSNEKYWNKINIGFDNSIVNDLVVIPSSCNTVYAATEEELKLNKTTDAGSSWYLNPSNFSSAFDVLTIDPNDPSVFYAAINVSLNKYYFYKGVNYGQYWTGPHDFVECIGNTCYTEITDILVKPGDSNSILISSKPYFLSPGGLTGFGVIARTIDGGTNWDELVKSPGTALAVDPQNPDIVYVGKERPGQVFKIDNAWGNQVASEITPNEGLEAVQDIVVDSKGNVFIATEDGLWRRSGENWTKLNCLAKNITTLAIDNSENPEVIYAGSVNDGIIVSYDSGDTWMPFNSGLGSSNIRKLVICNNMIYAGTNYGGVWSREIPSTISPSFLTHNTGNMRISVFQNGCIGHAGPNWDYGDGLVYKNNIDPLFNSGLIFGTSERGTVNGQLGVFGINSDFINTSPISGFETIPVDWDQVTTSHFSDNSATLPYGFDIVQRSYSNTGENILMLKYSIKNSTELKENIYVGLFADWDVGGGSDHDKNLGGFDLSRNLAYQYLENGNPDQNYYGIVALNGVSGTRITGKGHNMYIRDSSFVWISSLNDTEITEAGEYRMWIGSGPYSLNTDSSQIVCFAIVAGSNLEDIQNNADLAAQKYQNLITQNNEIKISQYKFHLGQNYPNPFSNQTEISYTIGYKCDVLIELFNSQGIKVKTIINKKQTSGRYSVKLKTEHLKPGIYFYRLNARDFIDTKKMVLSK